MGQHLSTVKLSDPGVSVLTPIGGLSPLFFLRRDAPPDHTGRVSDTILIVEDDNFARMALTETLTRHGMRVVGACSTAAQALKIHREKRPRAALLDLDLGRGPTGIDAAAAMRRDNPAVGIVFLTSYRDPRLVASRGQKPPWAPNT